MSQRSGDEAAEGEAPGSGKADPDAGTQGGFDTFGSVGEACEATETLREVSAGRPKGSLSGRAKLYPAIKKSA